MTFTRLITAATASVLFAGSAAAAQAPAAAAPAAAPANPLATTPPSGPAIPGVCVFSAERTIGQASVGRAYEARMTQLTTQVQAELQPERTALETEARTLQGQQATLPADAYQQRVQQLNQRAEAYSAKAELRTRELEATQQRNLGRITNELPPLLVSVYNTRKCAVVLDGQGIVAVNPAMDISGDVTTQLNAKMATITFDRERLDQQAAAPAPAAAAPARR